MAMKAINLREHETSGPWCLTVPQRDAIRRAVPSIDITPVDGTENQYTLRPASTVGALEIEGLSLHIRPKVCIRRLLYLALYAAGEVKPQEGLFSFAQADPTLPDLLAMALGRAAGRAFRQGLWRDYRVEEEALHTVRGRIMVAEQIRRRFDMPLPVEVRYDEYTEDVLANRLIKAAARLLRGMRLNDPQAREGLRHIDATLENVTPMRYPPHDVPEVEFTRLNDHYKEAVAIARLILRHWFHTARRAEGEDGVRVPGFLMDMNVVFQQFVTRALREVMGVSEHTLRSDKNIPCRRTLDTGGHFGLWPDFSWWDGDTCTFVGDIKYKNIGTDDQDDGRRRVPSADIYQALAYATAFDCNLPGALLVYAKGEADPVVHHVCHANKRIEVVAVDLEGDIADIDESIKDLAKSIRCLRNEGRRLREAQPQPA